MYVIYYSDFQAVKVVLDHNSTGVLLVLSRP